MTLPPVLPVPYGENAARHARDGEKEAQLSKLIARLRLTTFLVAAAVLVWTLSRGATPLPLVVALLLFVVFGVLVAWHARVDERVAWHDALRLVNLRALARRARDWHGLPDADAPSGIDLTDHPYALDLDLFGRASLFQWLGPGSTITWTHDARDVAASPGASRGGRLAAGSGDGTRGVRRLAAEARGARSAGRGRPADTRSMGFSPGPKGRRLLAATLGCCAAWC